MVRSVSMAKEILVVVINKIGVLAEIARILADHGTNIEAISGYSHGNEARISIVTDDTLRAKEALIKAGYKGAVENSVVLVELENKPGALKAITTKMAIEGIDIKYMYGSTNSSGCAARIILSTSNDEKVIVTLSK